MVWKNVHRWSSNTSISPRSERLTGKLSIWLLTCMWQKVIHQKHISLCFYCTLLCCILLYSFLFAFWSRHKLPCMAGCVCACERASESVYVCVCVCVCVCDVVSVWTLSAARTPWLCATGKCGRCVCQASYTWLVYMHYSHTQTHTQAEMHVYTSTNTHVRRCTVIAHMHDMSHTHTHTHTHTRGQSPLRISFS